MSECTHNCSSCGSECAERKSPQSFIEKLGEGSSVKKVIGIVSGKGGVGKSLVTGLMASAFAKKGLHTAGTAVEVEVRHKRYPAVVTKMPFVANHYYRG